MPCNQYKNTFIEDHFLPLLSHRNIIHIAVRRFRSGSLGKSNICWMVQQPAQNRCHRRLILSWFLVLAVLCQNAEFQTLSTFSAAAAAFDLSMSATSSSSHSSRVIRTELGEYNGDDSNAKVLVEEQLGYLPSNYVRVSAWTKTSHKPIAIQTYPLQGGAKRRQARAMYGESSSVQSPFPTLYWLTCPDISRCIGELERRGFVQEFDAQLHADPKLVSRLWQCHREYARERWKALSLSDQQLLAGSTERALVRMRGIMQDSGISGSNLTLATSGIDEEFSKAPPIKCLHAHYAHFCSTRETSGLEQNPVGEMIHQQLMKEFPDLDL